MFHVPIQADDLTYKPVRARPEPEALIREHRELVRKIAWHVYGGVSSKIELEDLMQIGLVALIEAAQVFEDRGLAFKPYAATRVRGAMIDQLRREATVSRNGMANRRNLTRVRRALEDRFGRMVTDAEMIDELAISADAYFGMVQSSQALEQESIDDIYQDDQLWFADSREGPAGEIERAQAKEALARAIADLPSREATVLQLYFIEECNLEEIGAVLEVGAARVCQLKKSALKKLKIALEGAD